MGFELLKSRLSAGRPLVVDADTGASFRVRGVLLNSPGALGQLLRERPADVEAHYRAEIESRVDVLSALTADTTPRALSEVGMEHRSAQLTGRAERCSMPTSESARAQPADRGRGRARLRHGQPHGRRSSPRRAHRARGAPRRRRL